jgi:hypothetical protein
MSDGKEYISNGCTFVENTNENRITLRRVYRCSRHLKELLKSSELDIAKVVDVTGMFWGSDITEFDSDLSSVVYAKSMFSWCGGLTRFSSDMPKLYVASFMFYDCIELSELNSVLNKGMIRHLMFSGCHKLPNHC